jgi:hypothetical protein
MHYFSESHVKPYLVASGYRRVAEIGSSFGLNADRILEIRDLDLTLIDPCFDMDLAKKYEQDSRVTVLKDLSLVALQNLSKPFDSIFIDGDHNWYTVFNELSVIHDRGLIREGGTVFFHDTGWMYGRRDLYYQPDTIPPEFRHPHAKRGLVFGQDDLAPEGATGEGIISAQFENALKSGGPRNGVLTAIEDFIAEHPGEYTFQNVDDELGLGILLRSSDPISNEAFVQIKARTRAIERKQALKQTFKSRFPAIYRLLKRVAGRN